MAVFKCKMCGGNLEVQEGMTVCECEYCGSTQTVPSLDDEKKITLFTRANRLRSACEFDKAAGVYESIVTEFQEEAEAYWGLILCKYGIEYVDDPKTGKKIPTCHRSSFDSVMDDENFDMVTEYSDPVSRAVYREEAKIIEKLRNDIIEVSSMEEPYDIFICYKETDLVGERTIDSVIAQDVYDVLNEKGYRVFFSRITLEDKLGQEYEPYIFAALNSAKIMLAFGTDYEYYNAVWVKNEWSRFLSLIEKGEKKTLIPCFKGIDAYDMPKEFARLQAQDMGKVGAIQDLVRGIEKILGIKKDVESVSSANVIMENALNVDAFLERAFMFLEDGKWESAEEYCEKVLDTEPKNAFAYVGKLMVEMRVKKREKLADCEKSFEENSNYQKAIRFGDNKLKEELEGYIKYILKRNENNRKEEIYRKAIGTMEKARTEEEYKKAVELFEKVLEYQSSLNLKEQCLEKAESCRKEAEIKAEQSRITAKKRAKRRKKIAATTAAVVCAMVGVWLLVNNVIIPNGKYNNALKLLNEGEYLEAYQVLESLNGYKDSKEKAKEIYTEYYDIISPSLKYDQAINAMKEERYVEAYEMLVELDEYKDSKKIAEEIYLEYQKEKVKAAKVGEYIFFGKYEQDNNIENGQENIEWLVLDRIENRIFVVSKMALDAKTYNEGERFESTMWETCTIRKWLNQEFINSAFTDQEQLVISTEMVKNNTSSGDTKDQIFLMSVQEAEKYFESDESRICIATEYAKAQGISDNPRQKGCNWWLRSRGDLERYAAYVYNVGKISSNGGETAVGKMAIRPAMWIDSDL